MDMKKIIIKSTPIGLNFEPFIIAELSGNHNQSLERALELVEEAAKTGVQAVKLQTYTAETMTIDSSKNEFMISDPQSLWHGKTLFELYKEAHTPWEWHRAILDRCNELGLICFSTPFDETAVDFLEELAMPCYKIASFENIDIPLIRKVGTTGKPIIISTGMASLAELDEAISTARKAGCEQIILLKCTSSYPASPKDSNLLTIPHMRELFNCEVGISDHTLGIGAALSSVALGASVIEKHFTLRRSDGGVDASFSMEPSEMKNLVIESKRAWQALGNIKYGATDLERNSILFRRSLYVISDVKAGDTLTLDNIRAIRPGRGLPPKYLDVLLGKKARKDIKRGTPVDWDII